MKQLSSLIVASIIGALIGYATSGNLIFMFAYIILIVIVQLFTYSKVIGKYYFYVAMGLIFGYLSLFFDLFGLGGE